MKIKKTFGGGQIALDSNMRMFNRMGMKYDVVISGSVTELHCGGNITRYVTSKAGDGNIYIGAACKVVKEEVTKYTELNGSLNYDLRTTNYTNSGLFNDYVLKGGREVYLIDIKACYWNILHNDGIISSKTYSKYLNDKVLRLVSVGNLNKKSTTRSFGGGKEISSPSVVNNPNGWVWEYVVYRAYEIFEKVNSAINFKTMQYKTDCFFVTKDEVEVVKSTLNELGYESSVERRIIAGQENRRVIYVTEDGEMKMSAFMLSRSVSDILPSVKFTREDKSAYAVEVALDKEIMEEE